MGPIFGGSNLMLKCMVILRDFPYESAWFGLNPHFLDIWMVLYRIIEFVFWVIFHGLYHCKSPSNHHWGEYVVLFPSILSKSKYFKVYCMLFDDILLAFLSSKMLQLQSLQKPF